MFAATDYFWKDIFLALIYLPIISWQETRIISNNINTFISMNKTSNLTTKKKRKTWIALLSDRKLDWSNPNCLFWWLKQDKKSENLKFSFAPTFDSQSCSWKSRKPVCLAWMTAVTIGSNLDWFLDMFWLALHTLRSSCTVSQVFKYYTLPLTRQPSIYLYFFFFIKDKNKK